MRPRLHRLLRYAVAALAVLLAAAVTELLDPVWHGRLPFVAFYPAVVLVAWFAGLGPGLVATFLSVALITRAWLEDRAVGLEGHLIALALFVGAGARRTERA